MLPRYLCTYLSYFTDCPLSSQKCPVSILSSYHNRTKDRLLTIRLQRKWVLSFHNHLSSPILHYSLHNQNICKWELHNSRCKHCLYELLLSYLTARRLWRESTLTCLPSEGRGQSDSESGSRIPAGKNHVTVWRCVPPRSGFIIGHGLRNVRPFIGKSSGN